MQKSNPKSHENPKNSPLKAQKSITLTHAKTPPDCCQKKLIHVATVTTLIVHHRLPEHHFTSIIVHTFPMIRQWLELVSSRRIHQANKQANPSTVDDNEILIDTIRSPSNHRKIRSSLTNNENLMIPLYFFYAFNIILQI